MLEVTLKINVKNHSELVEKYSEELKKQSFADGSINEKIECEIKKQMEEALYQSIKNEFLKNNVRAKIVIKQSSVFDGKIKDEILIRSVKGDLR